MASTISAAEIQSRVDHFNKINTMNQIGFSRRYNYYALDLYNMDGSLLYTLKTGTKRELYTYMTGIMKAMDMFDVHKPSN